MENNYGFYYNPSTNTISICSMDDEIVRNFEKIEASFKEFDRKKFNERIKGFKEQK